MRSWVKAIWRWTSKWLSGFIGRLPIYVLPLVLLGIEFFFRSATKHDAHAFIGPTAAAAGIALLIPTVTGRPLTLDKMDRLEALYKKTYPADEVNKFLKAIRDGAISGKLPLEDAFRSICLVVLVLSVGVWSAALYFSIWFQRTAVGRDPYLGLLRPGRVFHWRLAV